jgi:hypothetical protein
MSSFNKPQPESTQNDELVAYLDGELTPDECRAVEERLANDAEYRQQLRDLDQAWEALEALPTSTVDDAFARTTIELACVAAQEDVSQRKSVVAAENRSRRQWWVAGAVAAGVVGFLMMRALAVHRNNLQLADLPVYQQADVLAQVDSIDFLRQLFQSVKIDELARDSAAFNSAFADFQQASSPTLAERRRWVDSLSAERKSNLADNARTFEELPTPQEEKDRRRQLALDLQNEPDLQKTLIAYGQWLNRSPHNGPWREGLREELSKLRTPSEKVAAIEQRLHQEANRLQHLSTDDRNALRLAILKVAEERTDKLQWRKSLEGRRLGPGREDLQFWAILKGLGSTLGDKSQRDATIEQLVHSLSAEAQAHWRGMKKEQQYAQLIQWIRDLRSTGNDEDLEKFFASDKVSMEDRQRLLEMSSERMKEHLEGMYLESEIGFNWPELFEGGRGPGNGPPPGLGPGRSRQRGDRGPPMPDGPLPPGRRGGPGFRPGGPPSPNGPPPPDGDFKDGPPGEPGGPPHDGPPPPHPPNPPQKPAVEEAI